TLVRQERKAESAPLILANSAILLPARHTPSLLDMSAIVAKRRVLAYTLKRHRGNIEKVAAALGVSLYSLVKEMRILKTPLPAQYHRGCSSPSAAGFLTFLRPPAGYAARLRRRSRLRRRRYICRYSGRTRGSIRREMTRFRYRTTLRGFDSRGRRTTST